MGKTEAHLTGTRATDSREIKAEIEQTRAEMDRTVDELAEQLRPRHILDGFLEKFSSQDSASLMRSGARGAGKWLLHGIGQHPLPSVLIGAGVAWLIKEETAGRGGKHKILYAEPEISGDYPMASEPGFEKTTSPGLRNEMDVGFGCSTDMPVEPGHIEESKSRVSDAASRAKAKVSETAGKVSEKVSETASKVSGWSKEKMQQLSRKSSEARGKLSESTEEMRYGMRDRMERAKSRLISSKDRTSELVEEYPLVVGISAMAIGLLVGLSIPSSRRERRILGSKASQLREQVRETAENVIERGKEAVEAAKREAQRQGLTGEGIKESIKEVARSAGSAAEQEGLTPQGMGEKIEAVAEEATEKMREEPRGKNQPQGF